MDKKSIDYTLYLVTDRDLMKSECLEDAVRAAIEGGVTLVQLREKTASSRAFFDIARAVKKVTDSFDIPLIVNDRVDIALAVGAAGVHVGQEDIPAAEVRRLVGPEAVVGVSASTVKKALAAERDGADYLGVGAMFATGTKADAKATPIAELRAIREAVKIPVVAIGGIDEGNIEALAGTGIDGIAVVSAILCRDDIRAAAENLRRAFQNLKPWGAAPNPAKGA